MLTGFLVLKVLHTLRVLDGDGRSGERSRRSRRSNRTLRKAGVHKGRRHCVPEAPPESLLDRSDERRLLTNHRSRNRSRN
jgi:hypothetical protein